MLVSDIMNKSVVTISPDESVSLASRLLSRHNVGSLPVCGSDGKLHGIVTDRDIVLRCVAGESEPHNTPVKNIMTRSLVTVSSNDNITHASELMSSAQVRRLPVVDNGKLVGMLSLGDMALRTACGEDAYTALTNISCGIKSFG
jgi:CBS domain-containing protein